MMDARTPAQRWADACCAANAIPPGPLKDRAEDDAARLFRVMKAAAKHKTVPAMILDGPLFSPFEGTMQ
jgi:hypothetical protein